MKKTFTDICVQAKVCERSLMKSFLKDEKGDTNFISILIILAAVIALSGVFIGFGDDIVAKVKEVVEGFTAPSFG